MTLDAFTHVPWPMDTGWVTNERPEEAVVASLDVQVPGASSLRLYFGMAAVGPGRVRATSLLDGAQQTLDLGQLQQWSRTTAFFNGDRVLVELVQPPGSGPCRLVLDTVQMGVAPIDSKSQCGLLDDRLPSNDPRIARIVPAGCTAWLIDDCAHCLLTAGHCNDFDEVDVIEFNVPASTLTGQLIHPGPQDQYVVDKGSLQTDGGAGVGKDWAYFGVFPNPVTGKTPGEAQGAWFRLAPPPAAASEVVRVTGFGSDFTPSPTLNQTQQSATGPLVTSSGSVLEFQVDTQGGNSGSPIVLESTGEAIGINTHGGCEAAGGANRGTASTLAELQAALADPKGVCRGSCGWTDLGHALAGSFGPPQFQITGQPHAGAPIAFVVSGLPQSGATNLVTGLSVLEVPFKGGVLVPAPDLLVAALPIVAGTCTFSFDFPAVPAGTMAWFQFWTPDAGAVHGLSASNGVQLLAP